MAQVSHPFWRTVKSDAGGDTSDISFHHPFFGPGKVNVLLGNHQVFLTDEERRLNPGQFYKPSGIKLDETILSEFADTYTKFIERIDINLELLQHVFFRFYREWLLPQLPEVFDEFIVIETIEKHNNCIKSLALIRVESGKSISLRFAYPLFWAPYLDVDFVNGKLDNIAGERINDNWLP